MVQLPNDECDKPSLDSNEVENLKLKSSDLMNDVPMQDLRRKPQTGNRLLKKGQHYTFRTGKGSKPKLFAPL